MNDCSQFLCSSVLGKGVPCNPSCFRKKFREALSKIEGVRVLTPHCCRHTYVSQMQALGVDLHADVVRMWAKVSPVRNRRGEQGTFQVACKKEKVPKS